MIEGFAMLVRLVADNLCSRRATDSSQVVVFESGRRLERWYIGVHSAR